MADAARRPVSADLVFDSRTLRTLPGFRGAPLEGYQLAYASAVADIELQVTPAQRDPLGTQRVQGQVGSADERESRLVTIFSSERGTQIITVHTDPRGYFDVVLGSGSYDFLIGPPGPSVLIGRVDVG